jgi:predicted Ser/Thr protein kinase
MPVPEAKPVRKMPGRIGTTLGDYEIEGELGRGGMGIVYRARQKELNRLVALKMLTGHYGKEELQRFLAEAQTAAGLHHTNIVHIYEVGEIDDSPYFSMEFVEGGTLADRLKKGLPNPRESAELLMPVARALHFAHQHGVVHRDMKPHNILIDPDGVPKVADFGIAKRMDDDSALTRSGAVIGTPTYMAPEQAKGTSRDVGPAADVYSLGAILYEMLTGRPPFLPEESETPMTIRVLTEDTPSPAWHRPEIPREIEIICMKCLQKDPRDRYSSAAAFAEDLRRFLDDEGILARPPSRLGKAVKWTRRHPWKFTLTTALLIALGLGGERLYRWEFYERLRIEYAATLDYVHGALESVDRLKASDAKRRAVSLRLTRRGRHGPVMKVEVLNPRGKPAAIRRLQMEEAIHLYIEGLGGAQPYGEKSPESATVEMTYDQKTLLEMIGRDRDGAVNWRILYDRPIASGNTVPIVRARFTNLRGLEKSSSKGASLMEFERDATGRDVRVTFFDTGGKPALNGDGVYGYEMERDATGHLTRIVNLGRDGRPAPNREGLTACTIIWEAPGRATRIEMRDAVGKLALWDGIGALATDYDAVGNPIRVRRLGLNDRPAQRAPNDWVVQEMPRNERGELMARKYLQFDEHGQPVPLWERSYSYDENGHPTEVGFSAGSVKYRTVLRHEANGTLVEERYLDGEGRPATQPTGYAARRITYQKGPKGLRTEETYFDGNGAPAYNKSGYRRMINEYGVTGMLYRQSMEDHDPARFRYYRYVCELDLDLRWRLQRSVIRYENEEGELVNAEAAGLPYNLEDEEYDESGREIVTWQYGWSVKKYGASIWRKNVAWYHIGGQNTGALRHLSWQACDEKRQPLEKVANRDPARIETDYDADGKVERQLDADFDEARLGYRSRELLFLDGKLHRIVHRNGAGQQLKDIRVFVTSIRLDAPAKSAELKVADQLLSGNGEPGGTAYEWMLGTRFNGGSIEILRDGQRLRIDGFADGKLGVMLEDRGPGVPALTRAELDAEREL